MKNLFKIFSKNSLYFIWIISIISSTGSFYFSDILGLAPCVLCWYQRVLMFPLIIIVAVAIMKKEQHATWYILPFSIAGMCVAFYHYLLQAGVIPEKLAPCAFGVSCVTKTWELFGFITIPLLSFLAFTFITFCIIIFNNYQKHERRN